MNKTDTEAYELVGVINRYARRLVKGSDDEYQTFGYGHQCGGISATISTLAGFIPKLDSVRQAIEAIEAAAEAKRKSGIAV